MNPHRNAVPFQDEEPISVRKKTLAATVLRLHVAVAEKDEDDKARAELVRLRHEGARVARLLSDAKFYTTYCLDEDKAKAREVVRKLTAVLHANHREVNRLERLGRGEERGR